MSLQYTQAIILDIKKPETHTHILITLKKKKVYNNCRYKVQTFDLFIIAIK